MKIAYIFKGGRKERLFSKDNFANDFFYGYLNLLEKGHNLDCLEEDDIANIKFHNLISKLINKISSVLWDLPLNLLLNFLLSKGYNKFKNIKILIATTNSFGITLAIAKKLNLIEGRIFFLSMGSIPLNASFFKKQIYKFILRDIEIIVFSKAEYMFLKNLNFANLEYIPFGIDYSFWKNNRELSNDYVLAIGNDKNRDWDLLVESWLPEFPLLKIITSRNISSNKENIEILNGDWREKIITDSRIKELYIKSKFVILPLKNTIQPSGQSCCLQAMACKKTVMISDIDGIWDRDLLIHKYSLYLIEHSSVDSIQNGVLEVLNNKDLRTKIAKNGKNLVKNYLNSDNMSKILIQKIEQ